MCIQYFIVLYSTVYTAVGIPIVYYTSDDGLYTCPKHVDFYTKINVRVCLRSSASGWFLL